MLPRQVGGHNMSLPQHVLVDAMLLHDSKGQLKGLFIPDGASEDDVPETIVNMCITQFNINPEEFYSEERPSLLH